MEISYEKLKYLAVYMKYLYKGIWIISRSLWYMHCASFMDEEAANREIFRSQQAFVYFFIFSAVTCVCIGRLACICINSLWFSISEHIYFESFGRRPGRSSRNQSWRQINVCMYSSGFFFLSRNNFLNLQLIWERILWKFFTQVNQGKTSAVST